MCSMFQSTPVIANGRILLSLAWMLVSVMFQSTPVIANGRIRWPPLSHPTKQHVSIHARYC